jgi:predicted  nucleic acid-binding Zn-ribbon protein
LRDQLKRLEELQRYDAQIQELTTALQAIPAKLQATQSDLTRVEGMLNAERTQLTESQRYYSEQKGLLEADETHVAGAKHKLSQAKNSKEYVAAQREIDTTRESVQNREVEMTKLVDAVKAKEKLLADRGTDVQALRDSIAKDAEVAKGKMDELESKIAAIKTERDKIAVGIKPDVLKRYGTIRMRRGLAVVAVRNGTCSGCNMNMPPQLYNTLQRGTSLETCPYCHRMIYWDELMKDPKDVAAAAEAAEKPEKPEKPGKAGKASKSSAERR